MARDDDDYDSDDDRESRRGGGGGGAGAALIRTALLVVVMIGAIIFASGAFLMGERYRTQYDELKSKNQPIREIAEYVRQLEEVNLAVSGSPVTGAQPTQIVFPTQQTQFDVYMRDYARLRGTHPTVQIGSDDPGDPTRPRRRNYPPVTSFTRQ